MLMLFEVVLVALCVAQNTSQTEKKFDTIQAAVFSGKGYPKAGNIPVLNRKVFRASYARVYEHPYIASIRRWHAHYLTGAIISARVVITVAHPIYNVPTTELGVVTGETYCDRGSSYNPVPVVVIHRDFDPRTLLADLALLRVYDQIFIKVTHKPIAIFKHFETVHECRTSGHKISPQDAFVTGWGRCDWIGTELCLPRSSVYFPDEKQDPILRRISFKHNKLQESPYCIGYEKDMLYVARDKGMLCVGVAREEQPLAPCLAVPGAPLTIGGALVGLLSWGFGCGYTNDLPLIYTDVRYFQDWINESMVQLESLSPMFMSQLYVATNAYIVEEWVSHSHSTEDLEGSRHPAPALRAAPLDAQLVHLKGNVTDFRDSAYGGKFKKAKAEIYERLREELENKNKLRLILSQYAMSTSSRPFLTNYSAYEKSFANNTVEVYDN